MNEHVAGLETAPRTYRQYIAGAWSDAESARTFDDLDPFDGKARVSGYVEQGQKDGAKVVTGGHRIGDQGYFIEPTILTDTRPEMSVVREEIFGPVLCAMTFEDEDLDRIATEADRTSYGLSASVWTRDLGIAHKMVRKIRAGTVGVNAHGSVDPALPFGGFKQSGWGREKGRDVLDLYTEVKAVVMSL
jgi:phenylacetaldehyde dehydrogenase